MTEKLYYKNAYIKEFTAQVLECTETDAGFDIVLNKTAFFPEEGGQGADTGTLGEATVTHVFEKDGIIHHLASMPLSGEVLGKIDFAARFDKMQNHTAEHILCGVIHKLHGLDNVGFHLGADEGTFDISEPLTKEELREAEELANRAVFDNIAVECYFPDEAELASLDYRSKLELTENVRLVRIGEVDLCACCAPHVKSTGEVGLIKILEVMRHRGGMRIWIAAGARALRDYRMNKENLGEISAALSVPKSEAAEAHARYMQETDKLRLELKAARRALAEEKAKSVRSTDGNAVCLAEGLGMEELRHFVNAALPAVGGILVALTGTDGDYKYIIASNSVDLTKEIKQINQALSGRGGGKPNAAQGSFATDLESINRYFG